MFSNLRSQASIKSLIMASFVMVAFQNCAKIGVTDTVPVSGLNDAAGVETLPDLVVVTPDDQTGNSSEDDSGQSQTDTQTGSQDDQAQNDQQGDSQEQSPNDQEQAQNDDNQEEQQNNDQNDQEEQANNDQEQNNNDDSNQQPDEQAGNDSSDDNTDSQNDDQEVVTGRCGDHVISDVMLSVQAVSSSSCGKQAAQIALVGSSQSITLENNTVEIEALQDITLDSVKLVLNSQGNVVLSSQSEIFELKTPSGQQSGVKVHLDKSARLKKGQRYTIALNITTETQIVQTKKKCIFKPVIKSATVLGLEDQAASLQAGIETEHKRYMSIARSR